MLLSELKPRTMERVIDLVQAAGLDVSDWANFPGGKERASTNPKYCYEWAFIDPNVAAVLNIWFEDIKGVGATFQYETNERDLIKRLGASKANVWMRRAQRTDDIIHQAYSGKVPVRMIVLDGQRGSASQSSKVTKRLLDPVPWAVSVYDFRTGQCVLTRGVEPGDPSGDTDDAELDAFEGVKKKRFVEHRKRERKLRDKKIAIALAANGGRLICEVPNCNFDFEKVYGAIGAGYAQVHHKVPLSEAPSEGIKTKLTDLAVVCANCHSMIHVGGECRSMAGLIPTSRR